MTLLAIGRITQNLTFKLSRTTYLGIAAVGTVGGGALLLAYCHHRYASGSLDDRTIVILNNTQSSLPSLDELMNQGVGEEQSDEEEQEVDGVTPQEPRVRVRTTPSATPTLTENRNTLATPIPSPSSNHPSMTPIEPLPPHAEQPTIAIDELALQRYWTHLCEQLCDQGDPLRKWVLPVASPELRQERLGINQTTQMMHRVQQLDHLVEKSRQAAFSEASRETYLQHSIKEASCWVQFFSQLFSSKAIQKRERKLIEAVRNLDIAVTRLDNTELHWLRESSKGSFVEYVCSFIQFGMPLALQAVDTEATNLEIIADQQEHPTAPFYTSPGWGKVKLQKAGLWAKKKIWGRSLKQWEKTIKAATQSSNLQVVISCIAQLGREGIDTFFALLGEKVKHPLTQIVMQHNEKYVITAIDAQGAKHLMARYILYLRTPDGQQLRATQGIKAVGQFLRQLCTSRLLSNLKKEYHPIIALSRKLRNTLRHDLNLPAPMRR